MAHATELTANRKLGPMSTTYAAIGSCPTSCALLKSRSCYGMMGPVSWQWRKLNGTNKAAIARDEARHIDGLTGLYDLRIHTLGDCSSDQAAQIVSAAAERFMQRHGKQAFGYTHAWRDVSRRSWGEVSVLASCETPTEVRAAKRRGWATAIVVTHHQQDTAYWVDGIKLVPCPEQTGRVASCHDCRLCMRDDKLKAAGVTIAFAAHGPKGKVQAMLQEKNDAT